jgi:flagellar basal body-associated protein FliL
MIIKTHGSVILIVVIAAVGIVGFMAYFSSQHEWDQNEERYQFLLQKEGEAASSNE